MQSARIIQLTCHKIIDAAAVKQWDKYVWESTWPEYQLQVQFYDQEKGYPLFSDLPRQVPAAEKLSLQPFLSIHSLQTKRYDQTVTG